MGALGCHSAYIDATVKNSTGSPIRIVEVDYPSASFGKESMPADAEFHYRFKILGNGATKVTWTDEKHQEHTVSGPTLHEGDEGHMTVTLSPQTADWALQLKPR